MDRLETLAHQMLERAYAPYSGFRVGAALEADDGRLFRGCNVENLSYGATICAERGALMNAVSGGARRFTRLAVTSSGDAPVAPCGLCRQALYEFAPDLIVTSAVAGGDTRRWTLRELLPDAFTASLPGAVPAAGRAPALDKRFSRSAGTR